MYQTEYLPLQNINRVKSGFIGGFCRWWFVPIEWIETFPAVNPLTQQLSDEPVLKENCAWLGPVKVPDHQAGWTQATQKNIAGLSYKQQVEGFLPGVDESSYTNISNLDSHKFCIVGKLRTNGILLVIGNDISGLDFTGDTTSGIGSKDTAGTKILFTGETMDKAVILPSMFVDDSSPFIIDGDGEAIVDGDNELIKYD